MTTTGRGIDISVYRNRSDALAISLDDDRIILPSGKLAEIDEAWEPSDEDFDESQLTDAARATLLGLMQVRADVQALPSPEPDPSPEPEPRTRRRRGSRKTIWLSPELLRLRRS